MDQFNAISQAPSVDMHSILMQRPDEAAASETYRVPIGTQADGTMLSADLEQITHMLVCGYSGSGKTSFVQTAALYLARNHSPKHIQFIVFDSKMVDYTLLQDLPHLIMPIITEDMKADSAMNWLQIESNRRLSLFQQNKVKNLSSYNQLKKESLSRIIVILDDFASLHMNKKNSAPQSLVSIIQNGRIVGIHIILVTSVTSSKILSKELLSMIPCTISFRVSERADSRLVIGKEGAETLRVPGELMIRFQSVLQKCKGAYLSETQMPSVMKKIQWDNLLQVSTLGDMAEQLFRDVAISQPKAPSPLSSNDHLIGLAMDYFVDSGLVSTTALQRRLKLGYAKAARIIDEMEELGLIGPSQGASPRRMLISSSQWKQIRKQEGSLASAISIIKPTDNTNPETKEKPKIVLREFEEISIEGAKLSIHDNLIIIKKRIMTKCGPGTTTPEFDGISIAELIYKKPRLFTKGFIQFRLKPKVRITNPNPELLEVKREELTDLLTIEFGAKDAKQMKAFMLQISEDTGVPLTEL